MFFLNYQTLTPGQTGLMDVESKSTIVEVRVADPAAIQRRSSTSIQKTIQKAIHARSSWIALDRLAFLERLRSRSKHDPARIQKTIQFRLNSLPYLLSHL